MGDLAGVVRVDGFGGKDFCDAADDLGAGNDIVHAPAVGCAYVHEFDEADDVAGAFEVSRHRDDVRVIDAAFDDHVDFYWCEACGGGFVDGFEHARDGIVGVVHGAEGDVVERVEADGDAVEACGFEGAGF